MKIIAEDSASFAQIEAMFSPVPDEVKNGIKIASFDCSIVSIELKDNYSPTKPFFTFGKFYDMLIYVSDDGEQKEIKTRTMLDGKTWVWRIEMPSCRSFTLRNVTPEE